MRSTITTAALAGLVLAATPFLNAYADNDKDQIHGLKARVVALEAVVIALQNKTNNVIFRDVQRDAVLNPGERLSVTALCGVDEVVVSGGFNFDPTYVLRVTANSAFFDGVHSGWLVDFVNAGDTTALFFVRVGLQCTQGTGTGQ